MDLKAPVAQAKLSRHLEFCHHHPGVLARLHHRLQELAALYDRVRVHRLHIKHQVGQAANGRITPQQGNYKLYFK